jgi:hypothetical protein
MRHFIFFLLITSTTTAYAGIWDTLFPPKPYESSAEALQDIKEAYNYAVECTNTPLPYGSFPGEPTNSPISSCVTHHDLMGEFYKRYKISSESIKTRDISIYLAKIDYEWTKVD